MRARQFQDAEVKINHRDMKMQEETMSNEEYVSEEH
jgi:hypothetical protein